MKNEFFSSKSCLVVFCEKGNCKWNWSTRIDFSQYVQKYVLAPPKFVSKLPQDYVELQNQFLEKGMAALLEEISNGILKQGKFESLQMDEYYKVLWTPNGQQIEGFQNLLNYIYKTAVDNELLTLKRDLKADRELGINRIKTANEDPDGAAPLVLVSGSSR